MWTEEGVSEGRGGARSEGEGKCGLRKEGGGERSEGEGRG